MSTLQGVPMDVPIVVDGTKKLYAQTDWIDWFLSQLRALQDTARRLIAVTKVDQDAAIATTPIPTGALAATLYRVTFYLRITQAAGISSSATVTLGHTDGAALCSETFPAVNGNTTSSWLSRSVMVDIDQATAITYAVAYASAGAPVMKFKIRVVLEAMS